jgi:hypothetical protein
MKVWRRDSWKVIYQEGGRRGGEKGDGFRISQVNSKIIYIYYLGGFV